MFLIEQIIIFVVFAIALIANLIAEARDSDVGKYYTKPLLIPLILVFYLIMSRDTEAFIVMALSFALLGDIFLLFQQNNTAFRLGVLSFFLSILCWISFIVTSLDFTLMNTNHFLWPLLLAVIPSMVSLAILWKYLINIRVLGIFYMLVTSILLYFCMLRFGYVTNPKAIHAVAGCIFFLASDFMIVWNRFKKEFKFAGVYIMVTYIIAIILLVIGFMEPINR